MCMFACIWKIAIVELLCIFYVFIYKNKLREKYDRCTAMNMVKWAGVTSTSYYIPRVYYAWKRYLLLFLWWIRLRERAREGICALAYTFPLNKCLFTAFLLRHVFSAFICILYCCCVPGRNKINACFSVCFNRRAKLALGWQNKEFALVWRFLNFFVCEMSRNETSYIIFVQQLSLTKENWIALLHATVNFLKACRVNIAWRLK